MRRLLGYFLVAGVLIGGASGCGSDDKKADTKSESSTDAVESGNEDVQAYCDAVDEYVAAVKDAGTDASKAQALAGMASKLTDKAVALAGVSGEDAKTVADCTQRSTEALLPG